MDKTKCTLGDRIKDYENISRIYLTKGLPIIIRIDGKAFHTFTKGFQKPFDDILINSMWNTCKDIAKNMQGCRVVYHQSDEMSFLLDKDQVSPWFENNLQKIVSVSASMATLAFNKYFSEEVDKSFEMYENHKDKETFLEYYKIYKKRINTALFDSRVFILPENEVVNYFIWRQQDAMRNSIQMVGRANFSHKELDKKSGNDIQEMLFKEKNINFSDLPSFKKHGACIHKEQYILNNEERTVRSHWVVDENIPCFSSDRNYIENFLKSDDKTEI